MDVGLLMLGLPGRARETVRRAEAAGFAHLAFGDTQNLGPEAWGQLLLAASASSRIRLGTGVTNPVTRDAALAASAALALQIESGGRAFCGIGRGDSALAKIGRAPERVVAFERYVLDLRAYLGGETVQRGGAASRIEWIPSGLPRVPVEIAASGPRVLELAARVADGVVFCLGADPEVLARALEAFRAAARRAGRDPDALRAGAFVNCAVAEDTARARALARGGASVFARFAAWSDDGALQGGATRAAARAIDAGYEMARHAQAAGAGAHALDDAFLDEFAIVGTADHAAARLDRLARVGLDFVTIAPGS
ncbi:MAG TPA: LLM class flavin-dependent oxidoreductase, partial [Myxococcota bacterium]|nr:LLM class flavin-dependent oxidoreductase [Myxococcota bacterium]